MLDVNHLLIKHIFNVKQFLTRDVFRCVGFVLVGWIGFISGYEKWLIKENYLLPKPEDLHWIPRTCGGKKALTPPKH